MNANGRSPRASLRPILARRFPQDASASKLLWFALLSSACVVDPSSTSDDSQNFGGAPADPLSLAAAGASSSSTTTGTINLSTECSPLGQLRDAGADFPLARYALGHTKVGRHIIYSWTTPEQIEELKQDPTLLTRSMSQTGEIGRASEYLLERAPMDPAAAVLTGAEFEKKRFGWSNAWATLLGWDGETYGDQLLEIRLKPEAWLAKIIARTGEVVFVDLDDNMVSLDQVLARPERIAGGYFVDDRYNSGCNNTFSSTGAPYREYFIANERMVEQWSFRTEALHSELVAAAAALETLRQELSVVTCGATPNSIDCWREQILLDWEGEIPPTDLMQAYDASLAFPNELYRPTMSNLDRLIARIGAVQFEVDPLVHVY